MGTPTDPHEFNRSYWDHIVFTGRANPNALKLASASIVYTKIPTGIESTERSFNCIKQIHRTQRASLGRTKVRRLVYIYNSHRMLKYFE